MKANTAITLLALGLALWLVRRDESPARARHASQGLCLFASAVGALTLFEYVAGLDLGFDHLIVDGFEEMYPGRMSPQTAVALVACGGWLAMSGPSRHIAAVHVVATISGISVLALVIAWIFGAEYAFGTNQSVGVAPTAAVAFTALWIGILCSGPGSSWRRLLSSDRAGGHAMRRLVPAVVVVVIGLGYMLTVGAREGLFTVEIGATFLCAFAISLLIAVLAQTSRSLERADAENDRLRARLSALADRDPLTGVFNRRRLEEELGHQIATGRRHGHNLSVLAIDLDGFKAINDSLGHAAGDELLVATARTLLEELRATDYVCRLGGDEFIALMPETSETAAKLVAEKLIQALRRITHERSGGGRIELHASIGVATAGPAQRREPQDLLAAADRAMYLAKDAGRDRVAADPAAALD